MPRMCLEKLGEFVPPWLVTALETWLLGCNVVGAFVLWFVFWFPYALVWCIVANDSVTGNWTKFLCLGLLISFDDGVGLAE